MSGIDAARASAEEMLAQGRTRAAYQALVAVLVTAAPEDAGWDHALQLLVRASEGWAAPMPLQALRLAAETPRDAHAVQGLGAALLDRANKQASLPELAAAVLGRAHALDPQDEGVLAEAVAARELLGDYSGALRLLRSAPRSASPGFLRHYLEAFACVMTGDVVAAREQARDLVPTDDSDRFMRQRLEAMFARHEAVKDVTALDEHDLRGWHFVLSGSLLLHLAPDGESTTGTGVGGRYAHLKDGPALQLEVLQRLETVLAALDRDGMRVWSMDQHESRVLGRAAALRSGMASQPTLTTSEPGLILAYDFEAMIPDVRAHYRSHRPNQIAFAHSLHFRREQRFVPDLVGSLYATREGPWDPSERDEAALAERIVDASMRDGALDDLGDLVALAVVAEASGVLAALSEAGPREPFWIGGPVALPS